jgi:hypothetical protein
VKLAFVDEFDVVTDEKFDWWKDIIRIEGWKRWVDEKIDWWEDRILKRPEWLP